MDDLQTKIQDAIKANLPAQIGDALKSELAELATLRKESAILKSTTETCGREMRAATARMEAAERGLKAHGDLALREAEVSDREREQALRDLKVDLFNQRHNEMLNLVQMVFKSPVFTTTVSGCMPVAVSGAQGGNGCMGTPGFVQNSPVNQTTTTQQL